MTAAPACPTCRRSRPRLGTLPAVLLGAFLGIVLLSGAAALVVALDEAEAGDESAIDVSAPEGAR